MPHEITQPTPTEEPWGVMDYVGDIALAPVRGVAGFGRSIYNLADAIAFDFLPDWKQEWKSESAVGLGIESVTQFLAGFVPVAGWIGRGARWRGTAPVIGPLKGGQKRAEFLTPGLTLAKERALREAGDVGAARMLSFKRGTLAGMGADALAFRGHEERLSNLIENTPLANPITAMLAADEDDGEVVGRIKNVLEGMGIGGMTEGVLQAVRGVRAGRRAQAAGADEVGVEDAVAEETSGGQAVADALGVGKKRDADERFEPLPEGAAVVGLGSAEEDIAARLIKQLQDQDPTTIKSAPRLMSAADRALQELDPKDLNTLHEGMDTAMVVRGVEKVLKTQKLPEEIITDAEVAETLSRRVADYVGMDADAYQAVVERELGEGSMSDAVYRMAAHQTVLASHATELIAKARSILKKDPGIRTPREFAEFSQLAANAMTARNAVVGIASEAGRTLRMRRVKFLEAEEVDRWVAAYGDRPDAMAEDLRRIVDVVGSESPNSAEAAAVLKMLNASPITKAGRVIKEYWINSILYSGPTLAINTISNSIHAFYRPLEKMLGATLTRDWDTFKDELDVFLDVAQLAQTAKESLRMAVRSWKTGGEPILTQTSKLLEHEGRIGAGKMKAISAEHFRLREGSLAGKAVTWFGKFIHVPTRVLGTADEFAKQLTFRMDAQKALRREALNNGITEPEAIAEYVGRGMDTVLEQGQAMSRKLLWGRGRRKAVEALGEGASDVDITRFANEYFNKNWRDTKSVLENIAKPAIEGAEAVTFTRDLAHGSVGRSVQNLVARHPLLTPFAPFIRTPTNILGWTLDRTAGNIRGGADMMRLKVLGSPKSKDAYGRWMQEYLAGGAKRSEAVGRMSAAVGISWAVWQMAANGHITGRGPEDTEQRKLWQQAGYLPYSFRVGDTWVSYSRMDPWATMVGVVADLAQFGKWAPEEEREGFERAWASTWTAITENLKNKTYLRGLDSLLSLMESEEGRDRVGQRFLGSLIPRLPVEALSGFQTDPLMREIVDATDALARRVPYFSRQLEPVRNVIGEPVHRTRFGDKTDTPITNAADMFLPTAYSTVSSDVIYKEMESLRHPFRKPRSTDSSGVNYHDYRNEQGQTAFDRMLQLRSEIKLNGKTLRQHMSKLIKSKQYQAISPVSDAESDSPRITVLRRLITAFHKASKDQMLEEFPDLAEELLGRRMARVQKMRAGR